MGIVEKQVKSIGEYLEVCRDLVKTWSGGGGELALWYRGQSSADWHLTPGEYRYPLLNADEIRSEFILKGRELLRNPPESEWEWYFLMQHYGLPTRLLDWTYGSLIGLYFALSGNQGQCDAAVWILDPWSLNEWSCKRGDLVVTGGGFVSDPVAGKYLEPVYKKIQMAARPISVVPPYNSPRITAQRGAFTIHGRKQDALDIQFASPLARIVVAKESVLDMRRGLRTVGISEFTLFPDLDGLCRDIRAKEIENC